MKKVYLVGITLVVVIIAFSFYLFRDQKTVKSPQTAGVVILLKKDVFEPETITLKKGTTVEFRNVDTDPHWPASNIHPTHQIYPEFDPLEPIDPGKSWFFTFEKIGEWKSHDHLSPSIRGKITVY